MITGAPIRIVMADNHAIYLDGLAGIFKGLKDYEIIDMASNGVYLLAMVEKHRPDIVLTDIEMPKMDGIEATRIITQRFPGTFVIALTMHDKGDRLTAMLNAGAMGYLSKDSPTREVLEAIRTVLRGQKYYCSIVSTELSRLISTRKFDPKTGKNLVFTGVELSIITGICQQLSTKEIADKLCMGVKAVETHRGQIYEKMDVKNIAGVSMYAVKNGLYTP